MRHLLPRPPTALGKRGLILLIFGFIWVSVGMAVVNQPDPAGYEHLLFSQIPRPVRALAWVTTGLLAVAIAFRPRLLHHDGFGFLALYVMPAERAAIFVIGWLDYHITGLGGPGYPRGLYAASVWLAIVAAVMVCATWPDPPNEPGLRRRRRHHAWGES